MKSNIILTGMPGSGKSTLGRALAGRLRMRLIDTDRVIEQREHMPLQEILDQKGYDSFLQAEERAVLSVHAENAVIATGGSVILSEKAMDFLRENGTVVFLRVSYQDLLHRIHNMNSRGIAFQKGQSFPELYAQRQPYLEKWAEITVDINDDDHLSRESAVQLILEKLRRQGLILLRD